MALEQAFEYPRTLISHGCAVTRIRRKERLKFHPFDIAVPSIAWIGSNAGWIVKADSRKNQ